VSESQVTLHGERARSQEEPLLSPRRAFVVQFRDDMDATPPRFSGRVERIVSGRATRFHSSEELWAFFTQVLTAIDAKPP